MYNFKQLKNQYNNIEIPDKLEIFIRNTIRKNEKIIKRNKIIKTTLAALATIAIIFIGIVNISPTAANAMSKIPVIKNIVQVVTFRELVYQDETHIAKVKVPHILGLGSSDLEKSLNEKYLEENTELYNKFLEEIGEEELSPQILALYTNYKIKTNTDDLIVVESIKTEIAASGRESVHYDNIDLKNKIIITLPSLFKDDSYIDVISEEIKTQMRQQMDTDIEKMYFIEGEGSTGGFNKIDPEQTFYINSDAKLVIVFDEYEVAPGSMGIVEFVIPTEKLQDILVSSN